VSAGSSAGAGGGSGSGADHASRAPPAAPSGNDGSAPPHDVFISYAHEDGMEVAALLEEGLFHNGLCVWRDETRLSAGDTIHDEIKRGLANSSHMVAVITPAYLERASPLMELGAAVYGSHVGRIIPVLHGTRHLDVERALPALAGRYMKTWDGGSKRLMGEIAHIVGKSQKAGPQKPASEARDVTLDNDAIRAASKGAVASIPRTIGGRVVRRDKEVDAVEKILEDGGRAVVIGDKGSGKSVLSCLLYERLAVRGTALLVRCDDFLGAESAEYLDKTVVPGRSLARLAAAAGRLAPGAAGGMTIIFDSLDAVGRDEVTMRAFRRLLEMVWGAGARTVVTVRIYDYEHSGAIGSTDWGKKYELGPLSDVEVKGILKYLDSPPVPPKLREMLSNPLNLHLFSHVLKKSPGADLASIGSEIDLYDAHWHHCVELEPLGERVRDALYDTAEEMTRARKTLVPYAPGDPEASARAQSAGMLVRTRDGGSIRYFHHAYLDYAMSRALLERHQPVEEYLRADEYNVFLRPTLSFALAMAHKRDSGTFASIVEGIIRADIKHHWKIVALESLASVEPESRTTYARLKTLLTDQPLLQRYFIIGLVTQRNALWLLEWCDTLVTWASDHRNTNGTFIVDYLKVAVATDGRCHGPAFAIATALAESSRDGQVRRNAVAALAGIDADGRAEWLKVASGSQDLDILAGVVQNLPRLLERDPDLIPEIFCNIYTYEETSIDEPHAPSYGIFGLHIPKTLANDINKVVLRGMFPQLLDANPPIMVRAFVFAAEHMNYDILSVPGAGFVDDSPRGPQYMEHSDSPLACIEKYMDSCTDEDFSRLIPPLEGTRLALLRSVLIDLTTRRTPAFLDKLVDLLSDPRMHKAPALERPVRGAIERMSGLLGEGQRGRILDAMGGPGATLGKPGGAAEGRCVGVAPPATQPLRQVWQVAQRHGDIDAAPPATPPLPAPSPGRPVHSCRFSVPGMGPATPDPGHGLRAPIEEAEEPGPPAYIGGMLDRDLDKGGKISLLESILEALDGRPSDLGEGLVARIEAFLIEARRDMDPEGDGGAAAAEPGKASQPARSVRGLAAECLIRLAALRKDGAVLGAIRELSEDPAGAVRRDVARSLEHLFPAHYDLARDIAVSYSRDTDERVLSSLPMPLCRVAFKDPAAASAAIVNILESTAHPPNGLVHLFLWLAIDAKEPRSAELLCRIADEGAFSKELRKDIPFVLTKYYLASRGYRVAALGVLYALLNDPDRMVRYNATFFMLHGFDDDPTIDDREYIREIAPHLDRVSSLLEEKPLDLGIAEAFTSFLVKFWKEVPETALACLEKTSRIHGVPAVSEPTIADDSLNVLAGLLRHHSLYDGEWNRCLDVLDAYAAAGWPAALDLLAKMGARD